MENTSNALIFFCVGLPSPPDEQPSPDERMTYIEREWSELQKRMTALLQAIRRDEIAPLTPSANITRRIRETYRD